MPKQDYINLSNYILLFYCNNTHYSYFIIALLLYYNNKINFLSLGTIRQNRLRNLEIVSDKELLKKGRGSYEEWTSNSSKISVTKWADNKCVTLVSSFVGASPLSSIKRYSRESKRKVNVDCPHVITEYNSHMGGVDLSDMLVSLYRTNFKPRKWYKRIFSQFLDIAVNNAWLLYSRDFTKLHPNGKHLSLKHFRIMLSNSMHLKGRKGRPSKVDKGNIKPIRKPVVSRPEDDIRYDGVGHFPTHTKMQRCKL